jgi:hypothetical protein
MMEAAMMARRLYRPGASNELMRLLLIGQFGLTDVELDNVVRSAQRRPTRQGFRPPA